jgi:hypothetical protein
MLLLRDMGPSFALENQTNAAVAYPVLRGNSTLSFYPLERVNFSHYVVSKLGHAVIYALVSSAVVNSILHVLKLASPFQMKRVAASVVAVSAGVKSHGLSNWRIAVEMLASNAVNVMQLAINSDLAISRRTSGIWPDNAIFAFWHKHGIVQKLKNISAFGRSFSGHCRKLHGRVTRLSYHKPAVLAT